MLFAYSFMSTVNSDILFLSHTVFHPLYSREECNFGCSHDFVGLPHLTHLIQLIRSLVESARLMLGVAYQGDIQNVTG